MKRKSPVAVKIIACLLLLGSLACFLLPWMKLAADVGANPVRMSPGEVLQNFAGMDEAAVKTAARTGLTASGVQMEPAALERLLDRTLDGRFRPHDLALLCQDTGKLCDAFQREDLGRSLDLAGMAVWGAFGLLALLGLVALICQLTDHRGGIVPYFLLGALICTGLLLLRREANAYLAEQSQALLDGYGLGSLTGLLNIDVQIVKMGIGAYLCPFLALLALLLMGIRKKQPKLRYEATPYPARRTGMPPERSAGVASRPAASAGSGWTCPNCGQRMGQEERFCGRCGTERPRRPALIYCTVCGRPLPRDATFGCACGAPVEKETASGAEDRR